MVLNNFFVYFFFSWCFNPSSSLYLWFEYVLIMLKISFSIWFFDFETCFCSPIITCLRHQKTETTNSPNHEFNVVQKGQQTFRKPFIMVNYFLCITLKNIFTLSKIFYSTLNWWIRGSVFWCLEKVSRNCFPLLKYASKSFDISTMNIKTDVDKNSGVFLSFGCKYFLSKCLMLMYTVQYLLMYNY